MTTAVKLRPTYAMRAGDLLGIDANPKTVKGRKLGIATGILYMAPALSAMAEQAKGIRVHIGGDFDFPMPKLKNLCPYASDGCLAACLNTSGKGGIPSVQNARIRKAREYQLDTANFMIKLDHEVTRLKLMAKRDGLLPAVRLNGTTDILWEREDFTDSDGVYWSSIMAKHDDVAFYDYSKVPMKFRQIRPANYDLTFSLSESNDDHALEALKLGHNVAVVFNEIPAEFMGHKVIIGDESDARFLDEKGVIVGLTVKRTKGDNGRHVDTSGFVRN